MEWTGVDDNGDEEDFPYLSVFVWIIEFRGVENLDSFIPDYI